MKDMLITFGKPLFTLKDKPNVKTRIYVSEHYCAEVPAKSCFFCKHCSDIFYDFTFGPYLVCCDTYIGSGLTTCSRYEER